MNKINIVKLNSAVFTIAIIIACCISSHLCDVNNYLCLPQGNINLEDIAENEYIFYTRGINLNHIVHDTCPVFRKAKAVYSSIGLNDIFEKEIKEFDKTDNALILVEGSSISKEEADSFFAKTGRNIVFIDNLVYGNEPGYNYFYLYAMINKNTD